MDTFLTILIGSLVAYVYVKKLNTTTKIVRKLMEK